MQPVRAQIRPDQGLVGAGNEWWLRDRSSNPPFSRTSWPELAWTAGQTVKGQLLTTVRVMGAYSAVDKAEKERRERVRRERGKEAMGGDWRGGRD